MADLPYRTADDRAATEAFFRGRPAAWRLFQRLAQTMAGWGTIHVVASPGRIALRAASRFAWVSQAYDDGSVRLRWLVPGPVDSPRLKSGPVGSRWSHGLRLDDLDPEVMTWLREAYEWDAHPADAVVRLRFRQPAPVAALSPGP